MAEPQNHVPDDQPLLVGSEDGPRGAHPARWVRPPDLDEFAYIASHDLKEPLAVIINMTELLRDTIADCPQRGDCATLVEILSTVSTLEPGDIVSTGTPAGTKMESPATTSRPGMRCSTPPRITSARGLDRSRSFAISPDGISLLVAHQCDGVIAEFALERGLPTASGQIWQTPVPVCLAFCP